MANFRSLLLVLAAIVCVARSHLQDEYANSLQLPNGILFNHRRLFETDQEKSLLSGKNNLESIELERVPIDGKDVTTANDYHASNCQLIQIIHLLHHPGCQAKAISSFACSGSCPSYVQTSTSRIWQHERSCSCCQQTGSQEATFTLDCPSLDPPYKKVKTYAPMDCMCRSCTDLGKEDLRAQELVEALAGEVRQ